MKNIKPLLLLPLLTIIAACQPDPLGPPRDVAYYKANKTERAEVIAKCDADPGTLGEHPNCVNAREAAWNEQMTGDNNVPRLPESN